MTLQEQIATHAWEAYRLQKLLELEEPSIENIKRTMALYTALCVAMDCQEAKVLA